MRAVGLPTILCANVRSCVNKLDDIQLCASTKNAEIVCITETWLHDAVPDYICAFPNYTLHRADRLDKKGGGAAVWVSNAINHIRVINPLLKPKFIDCVWLFFKNHNTLLINIYIPPLHAVNDHILINQYIIDSVDWFVNSHINCSLIICGDLNRFDATTICSHLDIVNLVTAPTRGAVILDGFFISIDACKLYRVNVCDPIGSSDHNSLLSTPVHLSKPSIPVTRQVYDMRQSNINNFVNAAQSINWSHLYRSDLPVSLKCDIFHETLSDCFVANIPSHDIVLFGTEPPWFTPALKFVINQRWYAFRSGDMNRFNLLKSKVKSMIAVAKSNWAKNCGSSSKSMWKTVNSLTGRSTQSNPLLNLFNDFDNSLTCANAINLSFASCFQTDNHPVTKLPESDHSLDSKRWFCDITPFLVFKALNSYPAHKASGSDLIPTILYKHVAHLVCDPLCHIYICSIEECCFPDAWKVAHVTPVPKCRSPTLLDLRPISLLSVPSKIFERFVFNSLSHFFFDNYGLNQFGFRPKSSTCSALITLHDFVTRMLDRTDVTGVQIVSYDYSKAFDKLCHSVIFRRLCEIGFPNDFIVWIMSYLSNRRQSVRVASTLSDLVDVTSGVPQGSVLGPALFSIVVADFQLSTPFPCLIKFADDFEIAYPLFVNSDNTHVINEHNALIQWSTDNHLCINHRKCFSLFIPRTISATPINIPNVNSVDELKLLGVTFTSNFNFNVHIKNIIATASRNLFALRTVKPFISRKNCVSVYSATVRTHLEYCSSLFIGTSFCNTLALDYVQSRAHRIICNSSCDCSLLPSLTCRRNDHAVKLFLASSKDPTHILNPILPPVSILNPNRFIQPSSRTSRRLNSFVPFVTNVINDFKL